MPRAAEAETDFDFGTRTPQSREADVPAAAVPEQFGERYRVEALLGRGGMAAVYRAQDRTSGRVLAIKHSSRRPDTREGRELCALFEREFHLLAQLSHPRVIEVYDFGLQDGRPYYSMELLDGGDPSELTPLPWRRACAVMHDVCSSLALLHSRRFVHRDVSPLNVRCTRDGFAKLIDFGAAAVDGRRAADRGHAGVPAARSLEPLRARRTLGPVRARRHLLLRAHRRAGLSRARARAAGPGLVAYVLRAVGAGAGHSTRARRAGDGFDQPRGRAAPAQRVRGDAALGRDRGPASQ